MPMRKSKKRNSRKRIKHIDPIQREKNAKHNPEKIADFIMQFPDSSRDSVVADARSYRNNATIRMAKANERRQKRNALRAKHRGNDKCVVNSVNSTSLDTTTKPETLPILTES